MATTREKVRDLVNSLFQKTAEGLLSWEIDELDGGVSADIGKSKVNIYEGRNDDHEPIIIMKLIIGAKIVDIFDDDYLSGHEPPRPDYANYYLYMKDLYGMAMRRATGADSALDDIILNLNNIVG
jgi:hypothetical protein